MLPPSAPLSRSIRREPVPAGEPPENPRAGSALKLRLFNVVPAHLPHYPGFQRAISTRQSLSLLFPPEWVPTSGPCQKGEPTCTRTHNMKGTCRHRFPAAHRRPGDQGGPTRSLPSTRSHAQLAVAPREAGLPHCPHGQARPTTHPHPTGRSPTEAHGPCSQPGEGRLVPQLWEHCLPAPDEQQPPHPGPAGATPRLAPCRGSVPPTGSTQACKAQVSS